MTATEIRKTQPSRMIARQKRSSFKRFSLQSQHQTLEERAQSYLRGTESFHIGTLVEEMDNKIKEISRHLDTPVELSEEQVKFFEDLSPTQSPQLIQSALLRKTQQREEMLQRVKNLISLKTEMEMIRAQKGR